MLHDWFIPHLQDRGLLGRVSFLQDGAPAHYAIAVTEYINEAFANK